MRRAALYVIRNETSGQIKIGRSVDPDHRLRTLQTGCPDRLRIEALVAAAGDTERLLHQDLAAFRQRGEWFAPAAWEVLRPALRALEPLSGCIWLRAKPFENTENGADLVALRILAGLERAKKLTEPQGSQPKE